METRSKLQKRTISIFKEACETIAGFLKVVDAMEEKMILAVISPATTASLAHLYLFFQ